MMTLLTYGGFVLLTLVFVVMHLRGRHAPAAKVARTCPRCHTVVADDAQFCGRCQAPLQAFALVTAKVVTGDMPAASGPLHAIVRADLCAGCATCLPVCPEPGAIAIIDKVAHVNLDACKGHGECAAACPVGAIFLTAGAAVQTVEVPDLSIHFESKSVPGLYVVGELGGRGLIKNAVNEGKLAVEHIAATLANEPFRGGDDGGVYDVIIVGSGPAGLSAGLEAIAKGLRYLILEQGSLADTIAKYPRKKVLFAEPLRVPVYGDLWVSDASKESLLQVWQTVIAKTGLKVRTQTRVEGIERQGAFLVAQCGALRFRGRRVVLAMGRRGTPRRLGVTGEDLDKVFYDIVEMETFVNQRMLVVGGGDSAVESALGLANQPGTTVTLSYRGSGFARVKDRNRAKLDAAVAAKRIEVLFGSEVREIRRDVVVLEHEGALRLLPNDTVIVRIGGEAAYPFLGRLGVSIVKKEIAIETPAHEELG